MFSWCVHHPATTPIQVRSDLHGLVAHTTVATTTLLQPPTPETLDRRKPGSQSFRSHFHRAFSKLLGALKALIVGLASTASLAGIAALLASTRCLARPSPQKRGSLSVAALVAGPLAGATVLGVGFWAYPGVWEPAAWAAVAVLVACSCAGMTAPGSDTDRRGDDLLITVGAGVVMITSLWLAQRFAGSFDHLSIIANSASPLRHDLLLAHGVARAAQADWPVLATLGSIVPLGAFLVARQRRPLIRASARSLPATCLSMLALLATVGALLLATSSSRGLAFDTLEASVHPLSACAC